MGELPADPGVGHGEVRVAGGVARLVRRRQLVGAGLVLYRQLPRLRRYLAYLPEGPVLDWAADDLGDWLAPMAAHLRGQGAFGVRMGPPVVIRESQIWNLRFQI